jgi:hypothetical protein
MKAGASASHTQPKTHPSQDTYSCIAEPDLLAGLGDVGRRLRARSREVTAMK